MKSTLLSFAIMLGSLNLSAQIGPITEICMVTVDSTFTKNLIIWERSSQISTYPIDSMRIYVVNDAGQDSLIATVDYDNLSEYYDENALVDIQETTYRIQGVDSLGIAGPLSTSHTTIHHTVLDDGSGSLHLIWTPYVGHSIDKYICWMDSTGQTTFDSIFQAAGTATSWWQNSPPAQLNNTWYMVDVEWTLSCTSTRSNQNTTRSNRTQPVAGPSSVNGSKTLQLFSVYPNPATDKIFYSFGSMNWNETHIELVDMFGKIIKKEKTIKVLGTFQGDINISDLSKGMYTLRVRNTWHTLSKHIIIQ